MIAFQPNAFEGFEENMVTVYDPNNEVTLVNGNPPVDQTVLVATLQAEVVQLNLDKAALQAKIDAAKAALA